MFYLTTAISVTIVILVLQNTYLYTKIYSSRTARALLALQGSFILWAVIRLAEAYAPTPGIISSNRMVQKGLIMLIFLLLLYLFWDPEKSLGISRQIMLTAIILSVLMLISMIQNKHSVLYYAIPLIPSEILVLLLWNRERKKTSLTGTLSLKTVIQSMGDCILVLDTKQRIMDANYSFFEQLFSERKPGTYQEFCSIVYEGRVLEEKEHQSLGELPTLVGEKEIEFLVYKERLICTCKATPLLNTKGDNIGTMISFHDITEYRRLMRELEDKKLELTEIKDKLQDYLQVANRLEAAKEKREIYLKIQNSIGQEIMELLTMLEVVQIKADTVTVQELELAVESCRSIIGRIRGSVTEIEKN